MITSIKYNKQGIEMKNNIEGASLNRIARIAGFSYLIIVTGYTLTWFYIYSRLIVPENSAATMNNIIANELLLRIAITCDLIIFINIIILALTHYIILEPVNRILSSFALCLRLGEAILAGVTVYSSFIVLQVLNGKAILTSLKPEQLHDLVGLFFNMHFATGIIPMVLTSLGSIVFCYLFFKSRYIPVLLSASGVFSYLLLLAYPFISILLPYYSAMIQIQIVCFLPSCIFELIIGLWLIIRGCKE